MGSCLQYLLAALWYVIIHLSSRQVGTWAMRFSVSCKAQSANRKPQAKRDQCGSARGRCRIAVS